MIIILSFRIGTSKNFDHRGIETCAIVSTQVTYETDHNSFNDVKCFKVLFFQVFYCNLKEKYHIRRKMNMKKKKYLYLKSVLLLLLLLLSLYAEY